MRRALAVVGLSLAVFALAPISVASAHASLENSIPAPNSVLEQSPPNIVLDFDEAIDAPLTSIELFDQTGVAVALGAPVSVGDSSIVQASVPDLADGTFAVVWRVSSSDGHVVSGALSFQIGTTGAVDGADLIEQVSGGASAAPEVARLFGVARFLALLGLIVVAGAGFFAVIAPAGRGDSPATRALLRIGSIWLLVGALATYGLHGARVVAGDLGDALSPSVWGDIVHTHTARAMLLRIVFAVALIVLLALWSRREQGWWRGAAIASIIGCAVSFSAAGHANATSAPSLWIAIDVVHLLAVALWIGGLLLLCFGGRAWLSESDAAPTVRRFSTVATFAVPLIVGTGVLQTLKLAGGLSDLTATGWGRALLVKVTLVAVLVGLGAVGQWLLKHDGPGSLRRAVIVEAVLGIVVVGLAAGLVALPPRPPEASQTFSTSLAQSGLIVDVTLGPGRVGSNEMHILVTPAGGALTPVAGVTARISQPARGIAELQVTVTSQGANHFSGSVTLPAGGDWTLELIVETAPGSSTLISTVIAIP